MRVATILAIGVLLCAAPPAPAASKTRTPPSAKAPAAAPESAVSRFADGWRADLALDGPLLGWALPRGRDGRGSLLLLVGAKAKTAGADTVAPCAVRDAAPKGARAARLYRWRSEFPERLEPLGSGLPEGALESADLDGDGEDEVLLERDGRIDLVRLSPGGSAGTDTLVEDAALGTSCCGPRMAWDAPAASDRALRVAVLGSFRTYRRGPDGKVALAAEAGTPKRVRPGSEFVSVRSPAVRPIGRTATGRMLFATEPEALGKRRLRTLVFDPDGPAESQVAENWSLFPKPERVVDSAFAMRNGEPVLIVTTTSAEKLSVLGEKALRVFPLGENRSRAGEPPVLAATTGLNLWQQAHPSVIDLDRDGRDDLVLAYWKGLKNSIAAFEVYPGGEASGFGKPRSMSFDVANGQKGFLEFGPDADGDGRPDLILIADKQLVVFPGRAEDGAVARPVETRPSRRIALPDGLPAAQAVSFSMGPEGFEVARTAGGLGIPVFLDVDGDGRSEAVFAGDDAAGGGRVVVVFLRGGSSLAPAR